MSVNLGHNKEENRIYYVPGRVDDGRHGECAAASDLISTKSRCSDTDTVLQRERVWGKRQTVTRESESSLYLNQRWNVCVCARTALFNYSCVCTIHVTVRRDKNQQKAGKKISASENDTKKPTKYEYSP